MENSTIYVQHTAIVGAYRIRPFLKQSEADEVFAFLFVGKPPTLGGNAPTLVGRTPTLVGNAPTLVGSVPTL